MYFLSPWYWYKIFVEYFSRPLPVTNLKLRRVAKMSKQAVVEATWTPSTSTDVVSQDVTVTIGDESSTVTVGADVSSYRFEVPEKTSYTVSVVAFDNTYTSDEAAVSDVVGDLVAPAAVTGLQTAVVEVVDVEE